MRSRLGLLALLAAVCAPGIALRAQAPSPPRQAVVETSMGTFVIDLAPDQAPNQVAYFTSVAEAGGYDGTTFHSMVANGMIQGGDPLSVDPAKRDLYGTGGLNKVKAEPRAPQMTAGSVAAVLVPGQPDSAGNQFFVVVVDQPGLANRYTVFGHVSEGLDIVQKISTDAGGREGDGDRTGRDPPRDDSGHAARALRA